MQTIIILTLSTVGTLVCGFFAVRAGRRFFLIRNTETSPIARLGPQGFGEIKGHIRAEGELLHSPLSEKPCVYFRLRVQERRRRHVGTGNDRRTRHEWVSVVDDERAAPFVVRDDSGEARLMLREADLLLEKDAKRRHGLFSGDDQALQRLMNQYGRSTKGILFNKTMRFEETVLEPGDELYVLGPYRRDGRGVRFLKGKPLFLVTDKGEGAVTLRYGAQALVLGIMTVVIIVVTGLGLWGMESGKLSTFNRSWSTGSSAP